MVAGGSARVLARLPPGVVPLRWSRDGHSMYVYAREELPARVYRVDITSGSMELWKEIRPADPTGIVGISTIDISPDARTYAYTYEHRRSELYVAGGLN